MHHPAFFYDLLETVLLGCMYLVIRYPPSKQHGSDGSRAEPAVGGVMLAAGFVQATGVIHRASKCLST